MKNLSKIDEQKDVVDKQYVDSSVSNVDPQNKYLPLSGGTITGDLKLTLQSDGDIRQVVIGDFNGDRAFDVFYAGGSIGNELDPSTQTTKPITAIGSFGKSGIKLLLGYSDGTLECYDTSTILYSLVWSDRISDQGAVASISVGERITIVSYTYGKIRIYDTNTMNEIENDGDYMKKITAISQGDTNDHIVHVINGTRGSGETSNSLCVFEYQD